MEDRPRLIEKTFPLKQAPLDSVHEKNVRHGHISTLHIWPARRRLAACRAASSTGVANRTRLWTGSVMRSRRPMGEGRQKYSTRSAGEAPSRSRRCGWAARPRPSTSTPWHGSSHSIWQFSVLAFHLHVGVLCGCPHSRVGS